MILPVRSDVFIRRLEVLIHGWQPIYSPSKTSLSTSSLTYFTEKPARSCVAVKDIPKGALVEVEVIAEI